MNFSHFMILPRASTIEEHKAFICSMKIFTKAPPLPPNIKYWDICFQRQHARVEKAQNYI
jgi:hypothetical protein